MHVVDVMQKDVISVAPGTTLKEAAALLVQHRISGLPVVDAGGAVVGVFSEADILRKEQSAKPAKGKLAWLFDPERAMDARKLAARTVGEAMTTPAITIQKWRSVADAARTMLDEGIKRLPVVSHGALVGIVTRSDLVRAFARSDEQIAHEIREDVLRKTLLLSGTSVEVEVEDGAVALHGAVDRRYEAEVAVEAAARVPGVVSVDSELTWREHVEA